MYREGMTGLGICRVGQSTPMSTPIAPSAALRASLDALAERVESTSFNLPANEHAKREALRIDLAWTIRQYLLPRLSDLDAPLLAVVIGSTGSGKSTVVNSLAQQRISDPGLLRPTTRVPASRRAEPAPG